MDGNYTLVTEFILLGFPTRPELQIVLFLLFLTLYGMILTGNIGLMMLIRTDPHLQTPMYFFLSNLSFADLCYSSIIVPKMLFNFLSENKSISYYGCALQFYFFCAFADTESFILAAMAYDRYVAICNPLLYTVVMSRGICIRLIVLSYMGGNMNALIHTSLTFRLCFCDSNEINHFFCDAPPLLLLSCSDTQVNELAIFTIFGFIELSTISGVLVSYCYIILSVLKIHSVEGRFRAFSTCTSHLTTVAIFQGTMLFMYFRPSSSYSLDQDKITSLFYTLVIPMLNPLIYSLRNKDVKEALKKLKIKKWF
ncbi:hypothetical protein PANDA_016614, partial [Ailuropoda melanoleuca]